MTDEEFEVAWPHICVDVKNVDTWKKMEEFMTEEVHNKEMNYEYGPMRLWLIPDFVNNMSVMIFMGSHSYIDGVSVIALFQSFTVNADLSQLP